MSKKIYKYPIALERESILMPIKSEILSVQSQGNKRILWVLIDEEETENESRLFQTYSTGEKIIDYDKRKYIGTCQMAEGMYVFHVFECVTVKKHLDITYTNFGHFRKGTLDGVSISRNELFDILGIKDLKGFRIEKYLQQLQLESKEYTVEMFESNVE